MPSATAVPALSIGLDPSPVTVNLRTDPSLFLSGSSSDKLLSDNQFRSQIRVCLGQTIGSRAGLVLGTGYNTDPMNGHALAKRAMSLVLEEVNSVFGPIPQYGPAILKDYHALSDDPFLNGTVTLEIYFLADPKFSLPKSLLGTICNPPPKTWCQGRESDRSLVVFNWDTFPLLSFTLDDQRYGIKPANGTPPKGDNRTIGCIMLSEGNHTWRAGSASGSFLVGNTDPDPIRLCSSPAQLCIGGQLPTTTGPGIK